MAQRDWGGGGDLSGLFGSLIDLFENRAEASLNRQIRQSEEDAAAQDAETYDQWVNGIIDDDAWMAYIAKRKADSAGDPEKLQYWTETERKHGQAIEDGQIEAAYQAGDVTIHDLIAHYSTRMADAEKNSPEYRENADRYYDLVDKRDADYIDDQSMRIVDRIERGQASYSELLKFYQGMLGKVRKTSPLYSQINRQITNIKQIVDGIGGGSGGGGGGGGRSGGSGSGGSGDGGADVLSVLERTDRAVADYYRMGNVFVPTGQAIVQSVFERYDIEGTKTSLLEAMKADSLYIEQMMEAWRADPDAPTLRTAFGQEIPNTPENRWAIYNQAIANYDYRAQLIHGFGDDADGAAQIDLARTNFVEKYMQFDNSLSQQQYWATRREVFNQSINLAAVQNDPVVALRMFERAGRTFYLNSSKMIKRSDSALEELQLDAGMMEELRYSQQIADLIRNSQTLAPEEILTLGSMLLDERPDNYFLSSERIEEIVGNIDGPSGSGLAGQAAARDGYRATVAVRRGEISEVEPWVYVARAGESAPTLVKRSQVASFLGLDSGDWSDEVRPFVERNAAKEAVVVYRALEAYEPPSWYKDAQGRWVDFETVNKVGRDLAALGEAGYSYKPVEELAAWRTVTDGNGNTWYVDPEDGMLYERLPFKGGINGSFDVADLISGGKINFERIQGAEGVVMGVGPGVSLRWAQELVMDAAVAGEIDMSLYHPRDVSTGTAMFDPMGIDNLIGMYWSEADKAFQKYQDQHRILKLGRGGGGGMMGYDPRRELAARNEQKRIARIREWYDENDERTLRRAGRAQNVVDNSIEQAARIAGVTLGTSDREVRPQEEVKYNVRQFETEGGVKKKAAPVKISTVKPLTSAQMDPKITTPLPSTRPVEQEVALRPITRSPSFPKTTTSTNKKAPARGGARLV